MAESSLDWKMSSCSSKSQSEVTKLFNEDLCGLPNSKSDKNNISKLTSASTKTPKFENDICFVFDPNSDQYPAEELIKKIKKNYEQEGKELEIVNFARDRPTGIAENKFFARCLAECQYTCIIVSRIFLTSTWNAFGTDMAIQDMLTNENKKYTVIVIVIDYDMKLTDLPLDLQTLSPILRSERYYESRLSKAFDPPFSHLRRKRNRSKLVANSSAIHSSNHCNPPNNSTMRNKSSNIGQPVHESTTSSTPLSGASSDLTFVPRAFNPCSDFPSTSKVPPWKQENASNRAARAKEEQMKIFDQDKKFSRFSDGNATPAAKMQHHPPSSPQLQISDQTSTPDSALATMNATNAYRPSTLKKMPPKSGSFSNMFQQSKNISDFPASAFPTSTPVSQEHSDTFAITSSVSSLDLYNQASVFEPSTFSPFTTSTRVPQEHSDTSCLTEMTSNLSNPDHQSSVFVQSPGLRNPVESDDKRDLEEIAGSKFTTLDMKEELFLTDSSDTSQKEIVANSFSPPSPSTKKKVTNESLKRQNDRKIVPDKPRTTEASNSRYASTAVKRSSSIKPSTSRSNFPEEMTNSLQDVEVEISDDDFPSDRSFSLRSFYQIIRNKFK